MSDIRLAHLRAYSPSAVAEGQEYWNPELVDLIDVMSTEVANSPRMRGLNPATGEIVEGPFLALLGHFMRWADDGQAFRVEAITKEVEE